MSRDGAVKLTDFGLARVGTLVPSVDANAPITATRMYVGTPAYMSPEQHRGDAADARSDQYSFCATLYEALCGTRPIPGKTMAEMRASLEEAEKHGGLAPTGPHAALPRRLRKCLARGLRLAPNERYPSVQALLVDLKATTRWQVRYLAAGVGAVAAITLFSLASGSSASPKPSCDTGEQERSAWWNPALRTQLVSSLASVAGEDTKSIPEAVANVFDSKAQSWASAVDENCAATHLRDEQSQAIADAHSSCLDEQRSESDALRRLLVEAADTDVLAVALYTSKSLPDATSCSNSLMLQSRVLRPEPSDKKEQIRAARDAYYTLAARRALGRYTNLLRDTLQLVEDVRDTQFTPLEAKALYLLANVKADESAPDGEEAVIRALERAAEAGDDAMLAELWGFRAHTAMRALEFDRADEHISAATIAARRANWGLERPRLLAAQLYGARGEFAEAMRESSEVLTTLLAAPSADPLDLAEAHHWVSSAHFKLGDYKSAAKHEELANELYELNLGANHPKMAIALSYLARVRCQQGMFSECEALHERALAIRRASFGANHRIPAKSLSGNAIAHLKQGKLLKALELNKAAIEILNAEGDAGSPALAHALQVYGGTHHALGKHAEAVKIYERALILYRNLYGPDNPVLLPPLNNIALCHYDLGNMEAAQSNLDQAIDIAKTRMGESHPQTLVLMANVAGFFLELGKHQDSRALFREVLLEFDKQSSDDSFRKAQVLTGLGTAERHLGNIPSAILILERAVTMEQTLEIDPMEKSSTFFEFAQALEDLDPRRASQLANKALDILTAAETPFPERIKRIRKWLRAHRKG